MFRTGNRLLNSDQIIWSSLNASVGSAFDASVGTVMNVENYAIARMISLQFDNNERMKNNLYMPLKMSLAIEDWEDILGIFSDPSLPLITRKQRIQLIFSLWNTPPTQQNVFDLVKLLIPEIFIRIEHLSLADASGSIEGGVSFPGGISLSDGSFSSTLSTVIIRIWKPRDHSGNSLMTDGRFNQLATKIYTFLDNYLPTYVNFNVFRYNASFIGSITIIPGDVNIVGFGTHFLTDVSVGDTFESVDDNDIPRTYTIATITDDLHLSIVETPWHSNTIGHYFTYGVVLDEPGNLDNSYFN